jgi:putative transposase
MNRVDGKRFDRRALLLDAPPVALWPTVDPFHLPPDERNEVMALCDALWDLFSDGEQSVAEILARHGVHRGKLYRAAGRCLQKHPDGRIFGFRVALPYQSIKEYERSTLVKPVPYARGGSSGAFRQLMRDYPAIDQTIRTAVRDRSRSVKLGGQVRQPIRDIHAQFIKACRTSGITADRYPLNTKRMAVRSLSAYISSIVEKDFGMAVSHARGNRARQAPGTMEQAPAATRPFEVVEFDGHKIDLRLMVRLVDPFGLEQTLELHRIWILVLIDVYTRAVLGYHIALGKEYNKDDVAAALQATLTPALPRYYSIPELTVREGGGFPSAVVPETAFACWDWFRMDGAKSHLAADTLTRLNQIVGCWTDNGPPGTPNDRPVIERFFHLIARHFAHRLPGTVGNSPEAIERALSEPKGSVSLNVELPELEDMIHVLISNYNATAHPGVGDKTPLEAMAYSVKAPGAFLRKLPMPIRSNLCLMQEARVVPIKGSVEQGLRPHINFSGVRYTSSVLATNAALIGRKLRIYYDVRDVRAVKAFFEDGTELGVLTAARPWHITPHSLRMRQEIHRLLAERKLDVERDECPVVAWGRYKWRIAKSDKRAANALAKQKNNLESIAATAIPAGTERVSTVVDDMTPVVAIHTLPAPSDFDRPPKQAPEPPAEPASSPTPKPMQIRRTITF